MVLLSALVLSLVCLRAAWAEPSVPVATNPVYSTETITSVSQSVTTYTSYYTSSAVYEDVSTYTTTVSGTETVLTATQEKTTFTTATNIGVSTIFITQQNVVVTKIGDSTVFSADPTTATTSHSLSTATTSTIASTVVTTTSSAVAGTTHHETFSTSISTSSSVSHSSSSSTTLPSASPANSTNSTAAGQSNQPPSRGLSPGDKAGVGIGTALGIIALFALVFYLGQIRARRKAATAAKGDFYDPEDDFLSHSQAMGAKSPTPEPVYETPEHEMENVRGYSTREPPSWQPSVRQPAAKRHSMLKRSRPEELTRPGYEMPNPRLSNGIELSGAQIYEKGDDGRPVYIGVPRTVSGGKTVGSKQSGSVDERPFDGSAHSKSLRASSDNFSRNTKRSTYDSIYPEDSNYEEKMNYF